jgi:hypothetical protein
VSFAVVFTRGPDEYWGSVVCGRGDSNECSAIMHKIVRLTAMEQTIVLSADQIAKDIGAGGKVVFYGILFDTDKATIRPESGPTLVEMAKWLKANAAKKVYIVGHTDVQGAHDHNMKLSRDRALMVLWTAYWPAVLAELPGGQPNSPAGN